MATQSLRNPNRRPTHPGAVLREDVLPALKMTQKDFVDWIGLSRFSVSELVSKQCAVDTGPDHAFG